MAIRPLEFQNPFSEEAFGACFEQPDNFNASKYEKLLNGFFCCQTKDKYELALRNADLHKIRAALKCHNLATQCLRVLLNEVDRRVFENLKAKIDSTLEQLSDEKQKKDALESKSEASPLQNLDQCKNDVQNHREKLSKRMQDLKNLNLHVQNLTKEVKLSKEELINLQKECDKIKEELSARIAKKSRGAFQEALDVIPIVGSLSDKARNLLGGTAVLGAAAYLFIFRKSPPVKGEK